MQKMLSEQQVLKLLNIVDFKHVTKDKVIQFASILDQMDPEVAKAAISQFPSFASSASEMLKYYANALTTIVQDNKESSTAFFETTQAMIELLENELKSESLSFDQRKFIIETMVGLAHDIGEKDTENKAFLTKLYTGLGITIIVVTGLLVTVLGGHSKIDGGSLAA